MLRQSRGSWDRAARASAGPSNRWGNGSVEALAAICFLAARASGCLRSFLPRLSLLESHYQGRGQQTQHTLRGRPKPARHAAPRGRPCQHGMLLREVGHASTACCSKRKAMPARHAATAAQAPHQAAAALIHTHRSRYKGPMGELKGNRVPGGRQQRRAA